MEEELNEAVRQGLDGIDFGGLSGASVFGGENFIDKIGEILSGEFFTQYPDLFSGIIALLGSMVIAVLPVITLIVAITILCGFISNNNQIVHFVAYAAVILVVVGTVADLIKMTGDTINGIKTQIDVIFPIILTLMVASGANASAGVYQPAIALLSSAITQIFSYVVLPLFIISFAFSVVSHISPNAKLDRFVTFFNSLFKWLVGICFTVFIGFMTVNGITAGSFDSVSIRAGKLTASTYIPIVGGYLSQGFDLIMASSVLIKNAVGLGGILLLLGIVLSPIIKIIVFSLAIKLASALVQPIADSKISNFLNSIGKCFGMLISCLLGVTFMYFVSLALLMMTGNVV
ncbi:MAG: stage III sporulation protein AE [Christensenellaceae bacterium]|jgi:stage III sporulation protein AE|nr:stage III sporulation protein AE [Christensenellaceae bacterium]